MVSVAQFSALAPSAPAARLAAADVIDAVVGWAPDDRIEVIRSGFPAGVVAHLAERMGWTKERAIDALKLKRSTVLRKIKEHRRLDTPDSERLMAVMDMIAQVEQMVTRSGASITPSALLEACVPSSSAPPNEPGLRWWRRFAPKESLCRTGGSSSC